MNSNAWLQLLVPVLGIALSPILIIAVVLVLGTKKRTNGLFFLLGWLLGLLLLASSILVSFDIVYSVFSQFGTVLDLLRLAFGLVLFFLAAKKWSKRPKPGEPSKSPAWMSKIDSLSMRGLLSLGLAISGANPKNIAFTLAAIASIAEYTQVVIDQITLLLAFVFFSSLSVLTFVTLSLALGDRATLLLLKVKTVMEHYNAHIMTMLFALFGVLLFKEGLSGLIY